MKPLEVYKEKNEKNRKKVSKERLGQKESQRTEAKDLKPERNQISQNFSEILGFH